MKKNILFTALLAAFALIGCSDEDHVPVPTYSDCQICDIVDQPELNSFDYEVCVATVDSVTTAYVAGGNTTLSPDDYFNLYCQNDYVAAGSGTTTPPGTGNTTDCVTCATSATLPVATQVCKGTNGHAYLAGVDTTQDYETFLTAYEAQFTTTCQ